MSDRVPAIVQSPGVRHAPASAPEVSEVVRDASARGATLRVIGGGTWLQGGRPVNSSEIVHLGNLSGIVEYEPGDLTLTARAGTPLSVIEAATLANGQFLALDPFGAPGGTLGATLATASYGPLGHAFGGARDATIGLEFVTGDGITARGGGRVVKNVAGFDLVRLLIGSWGTLGIITEASVRLRALPAADVTLALAMPDSGDELAASLAALRGAPLAPWSAELLNAALARDLGLEARSMLLLRLAGNSETVAAQQSAVRAFGDSAMLDPSIWAALRRFEAAASEPCVVRLSARPSTLSAVWMHAQALAGACDGRAHATVGRGVARVQLRGSSESIGKALALPFGGRVGYEQLSSELWEGIASPIAGDRLSSSLRAKFDPAGLLNPGMFGAR